MAVQVAPKLFTIARSPVPREYTQPGPVWLLKRDDPDVFFGLANGVVLTATIYSGADFREDAYLKPTHVRKQTSVQSNSRHFGRTLDLTMRNHGGLARTARDGPGQPLTMKAFYHPSGRSMVVAGWDPRRRQWVVE